MSIELIAAGIQKQVYFVTKQWKGIRKVNILEVTSLSTPVGTKKYFVMLENGTVCIFKKDGSYEDPSGMVFFTNPNKITEGFWKRGEIKELEKSIQEYTAQIETAQHYLKLAEENIARIQRSENEGIFSLAEAQVEYHEMRKTNNLKKVKDEL